MTGVDGGRPATEPPATFVVGYLVARGTALRLRHWCDACVQFLTTVWQHFFAAERSESRQGEIGTAASISLSLSLSLSLTYFLSHSAVRPLCDKPTSHRAR